MNILRLFRAIYLKKIKNIPAGSNNYNQVYVDVVRQYKKILRFNYYNILYIMLYYMLYIIKLYYIIYYILYIWFHSGLRKTWPGI